MKYTESRKKTRSDCEHSTFDRLGIFALPCQTKRYNKENFPFNPRDEQKKETLTVKVWILGEKKNIAVPLATATLEWNF